MRLEGKVVFLTGAGAGIAKATARLCAREGAKVAICELNREAGERAEREIRAAGGDALFVHCDVTQDDSVREAIAKTVEHYGTLNVLFNCAGGSSQEDRPVHEMDLDVWHKTVALNLLHPFLTCRHGIPHLMKAGGGSIINVTSHLGLVGTVKPAYAATKGGIISFTKTLAAQYVEHGIRANAIAPGVIDTAMAATIPEAARAEMLKQIPLSRLGTPDEVANVALFLCSPLASYVSGQTIEVNGGWRG